MILILGKNGYVSKRFQDFFNVRKIDFVCESLRQAPQYINILLQKHKPKYVINCIGYTGVPNIDECENNKAECLRVNSIIPTVVATACKEFGIKFLHVGTGCIYQDYGSEYPTMFSEKETPNFCFGYNNCSWYSGTKELAETMISGVCKEYYIMRLRMPFCHIDSPKNYLSKLLKYKKVWSRNNSISNLDEFVNVCYLALENNIPYGIYNAVNPQPICAQDILEIAKKFGLENECEIIKDSEVMKTITQSPRSDCTLSTNKLKECNLELLPTRESISRCFGYWGKQDNPFWI